VIREAYGKYLPDGEVKFIIDAGGIHRRCNSLVPIAFPGEPYCRAGTES
jgi:hypothetical protein